ncbi:Crp/Fnr family transcriptional regulator [Parasphingorhabdus sp.]|uniref:Crp/Fnr family transcriptional regulator n=1 Tax=Parasphingorhabdus sp. TaxID=2709688 RepID=UPI002F958B12
MQDIPAGQTLMWEGDEATVVANVVQGVLKLSSSLGDGREQIVGVAYPADFIGRPYGERIPYTVTALSDVRIRSFQRAGFEKFAQEHPKLEHKMLERTLMELDRAREWMLLLGRKTAQEKLVTLLLNMPNRLSETQCDTPAAPLDHFELPFGRQQMADLLGLTIETVSRQLGELTKSGLIILKNQREVIIQDRERLAVLAGQ